MIDWRDRLAAEPPVLVTGAAGFIGFHLCARLLDAGVGVVGLDNLSDYYDPGLKRTRLALLTPRPGFRFLRVDLADAGAVTAAFDEARPLRVVNLAAQAGVRYSLSNPQFVAASNLTGFLNVLEACRRSRVAHLAYASSSSVYGGSRKPPFSTSDGVDHPVSLYAATKKANELMAHAYADLYGLPATGMRFFTVYGPWGRPDMVYRLFMDAIVDGRPIEVFNGGRMGRDFTYVDDVAEMLARSLVVPPAPQPDYDRAAPDPSSSLAPHLVFNIGDDSPEELTDMIAIIERATGRAAQRELLPMQPGDVERTSADIAPPRGGRGLPSRDDPRRRPRPVRGLDAGVARDERRRDMSARADPAWRPMRAGATAVASGRVASVIPDHAG